MTLFIIIGVCGAIVFISLLIFFEDTNSMKLSWSAIGALLALIVIFSVVGLIALTNLADDNEQKYLENDSREERSLKIINWWEHGGVK